MCIMFHHIIYLIFQHNHLASMWWRMMFKNQTMNAIENHIFKEFRTFWSGFYLLWFWRTQDVMEKLIDKRIFYGFLYFFSKSIILIVKAHILLLTLSHLLSLSLSLPLNSSNWFCSWCQTMEHTIEKYKKKPSTDFYFLGQFYIMLMVVSSWLCNAYGKRIEGSLYIWQKYSLLNYAKLFCMW